MTLSDNDLLPLANIKIVLIQTFHPGNIGSAARAMKTMGLSNLCLVNPRQFPDDEATAMSANAEDLLQQATVYDSLESAVSDCQLVIGTSARDRTFSLPPLFPEQCAEKLVSEAKVGKVALVFGRERMGLHNDEIQQCHFQVNIPANPNYPVMNIASAIQVLCYEIFRNLTKENTEKELISQKDELAVNDSESSAEDYPLNQDLIQFYEHLESTLTNIEFLKPKHQGQTMQRFQRLFRRARLEKKELNLLRGLLSRIDSFVKPGE